MTFATRQPLLSRLLRNRILLGQKRSPTSSTHVDRWGNRRGLATYILRTLGDGTEMAHGVEGRLPFLDHPLVEFICGLPVETKTDGFTGKRLLREAMRELVPAEVCERERLPFTAPPLNECDSASDDLLLDCVHSEAFSTQPFFDPVKLRRWINTRNRLDAAECIASDPVTMFAVTTCTLKGG
jgi:asparagine synthase (glutamine-hydrolysing)